jgi:hypothetical protein
LKAGYQLRFKRLIPAFFPYCPVAIARRIEIDVGHKLYRIDNPQFANAKTGIEPRFAAAIVGQARIRHLDNEKRIVAAQICERLLFAVEDEIWFKIRGRA